MLHKGTVPQQSGFRLFPGSHLWTGTTGSVVKIWLLASSSTATPVNIPSPGAVHAPTPTYRCGGTTPRCTGPPGGDISKSGGSGHHRYGFRWCGRKSLTEGLVR